MEMWLILNRLFFPFCVNWKSIKPGEWINENRVLTYFQLINKNSVPDQFHQFQGKVKKYDLPIGIALNIATGKLKLSSYLKYI